ncbi:hypothetical protein EV2_032327 [Malus domestica]
MVEEEGVQKGVGRRRRRAHRRRGDWAEGKTGFSKTRTRGSLESVMVRLLRLLLYERWGLNLGLCSIEMDIFGERERSGWCGVGLAFGLYASIAKTCAWNKTRIGLWEPGLDVGL